MTTDGLPPQELNADEPLGGDADLISRLEQERDQMKALAQRARADYDNLRRRVEEERWALARNASNAVLARLLPCADDLERAVDSLPPDDSSGWSEGVRLVLQNIHALIASEGVVRIDPSPGDPFDPVEHEAVHHAPSAEQAPGSVLSTFRPGYRSADRVLRPAQVVVAKTPESGDNAADSPEEDAETRGRGETIDASRPASDTAQP